MLLSRTAWPADAAGHRHDTAALMAALAHLAGDLTWYSDRFHPYPIAFTPEEVARFARLRAALDRTIRRVVESYLEDPRLQRVIALPQAHHGLIARAARRPYRIGSFRPDLLLDEQGEWRVCEVNARFPVNGYLVSHYLDRCVAGLPHLAPWREATGAGPLPGPGRLLDALAARFRPGEPLTVVREREYGMDIHLLLPELARRGIPVRTRAPGALTVRRGAILDDGCELRQFLLELERDELLTMEGALFDALAACPDYFNDLRTLLITHDKRMLAVLSDPELIADYADAEDAALLARHLIPTWNAADPRIAAELSAAPQEWVLKRNSSGRGIGMLIGRSCDRDLWRRTLAQAAGEYTAQRFLPQRPLPFALREGEALVERDLHVVAMLPGLDADLLGPGFIRASREGIINVHGGRGEIVPVLLAA